jgi:lysophospholipase L1-like esterase
MMKYGTAALADETAQLSGKWRYVAIAYFLHLAVPAFLLVDTLTAWVRAKMALTPVSEIVVAGISALWLFAGLGFFFRDRNRQDFLKRIYKPLLSIYFVYLALILMEGLLHLAALTPPIPGLHRQGSKAVTKIDPAVFPGVSGTKTYTINQLGLRGPMPPKDGSAYNILAIGASTTNCAILDDSEVWSQLLMNSLNASQTRRPVWVGNAGVSGFNTVNHLVLMQWLPESLHVDMLVFLIGGNDLTATFRAEGAPTQESLERAAAFQGDLPPGMRSRSQFPLFRRLKLFLLIREVAQSLSQRFHPSLDLVDVARLRKQRAEGPIIPLPDLSAGVTEYRTRILSLARQCQNLELRCLFLTQPYMWRNDLSPDEERLLWMGRTGSHGLRGDPKGYLSVRDMALAMDTYNRNLLDVCRENGLECYDLASHIPKSTSALFDDMHFNEGGSRLVAELLKQYLLSNPPFVQQPASYLAKQ